MSHPPLYDPTEPEDLPVALRVAYGLIGILIEIVGERVEIPASRMEEITKNGGPPFGLESTQNGPLVLTPKNCDDAVPPSEFD